MAQLYFSKVIFFRIDSDGNVSPKILIEYREYAVLTSKFHSNEAALIKKVNWV